MRLLRRLLIAFVGGSVVLFGVALIFLPGPGLLTILFGLGILAIEFAWAKHWLDKFKSYLPGKKKADMGSEPSLPVATPSLRDVGNE